VFIKGNVTSLDNHASVAHPHAVMMLVSQRQAKVDTIMCAVIQLLAQSSRHQDMYVTTKDADVGEIRFRAIPQLNGHLATIGLTRQAVVEVNGHAEGLTPE
jgi:hypothetical protein